MNVFNPKIYYKLLLIIFCLNLFLHTPLTSQTLTPPPKKIGYYVDMAQFRVNDSISLAEIYFAIPRNQFTFAASDSALRADLNLAIDIYKNDQHVLRRAWQATSYASDVQDARSAKMLFSVASFQMKKGVYQIVASITDAHNQVKGEAAFELQIAPYVGESLMLSDLELASEIKRDRMKSVYYKNGYRIIPNPSGIYGDGLPILMVYSEIYNLKYPSDTTYTVHYRVYDSSGNVVKDLPPKVRKITGSSLVEVGGFNVISLFSGTYVLEIEVKDNGTGLVARRTKKFFIYRQKDQTAEVMPDIGKARMEALSYFYRDMSEKQMDEEFDAARWIATKEEKQIFKSLDETGKREFLAQFWQKRDTDTTTVRNEFREEYLERARYARDNFSGFKPGWRTDRGRVLLTYGRPDEIERFPSNNNTRAYEIWHYYHLEGGIKFIFVDIRGWGEFSLVHSTARGEVRDPDWTRWLRPVR
ncbi:MAG: GWxTD domain-containing protein [candidate division KSB1 bacterium]|nr:GWxTD domain-containing protein [candidate division KSB1 bacterium]